MGRQHPDSGRQLLIAESMFIEKIFKPVKKFFLLLLGAALCSLSISGGPTFAQGTPFTYQGHLNDGAQPGDGSYDLTFSLYDALANGNQIGSNFTNGGTGVSNGL